MKRVHLLILIASLIILFIIGLYALHPVLYSPGHQTGFATPEIIPFESFFLVIGVLGFFLIGGMVYVWRKEMNKAPYLNYTNTSLILFAIAMSSLLAAIVYPQRMTGATLILIGVSCFISGILFLTFTKKEPIDAKVADLVMEGVINICQLCTYLPAQGNAHFMYTEKGVMQMIPIKKEFTPRVGMSSSRWTFEEGAGVLSAPAAAPLLAYLEKEHHLVIPKEQSSILEAIREVFVDTLELVDRVNTRYQDGTIVIDLYKYRFLNSCGALHHISSTCCTIAPCPICNLIPLMISKGLMQPVSIQQIILNMRERTIRMVLMLG